MKTILYTLTLLCSPLAFLLLSGCTDSQSQHTEQSIVEEIASSPEYYNLQIAEQQMVEEILNRTFNVRKIVDEVGMDGLINICDLETKNYNLEGLDKYKDIKCSSKKAFYELHEAYPELKNLSSEQKKKISSFFKKNIYTEEIKIPDPNFVKSH